VKRVRRGDNPIESSCSNWWQSLVGQKAACEALLNAASRWQRGRYILTRDRVSAADAGEHFPEGGEDAINGVRGGCRVVVVHVLGKHLAFGGGNVFTSGDYTVRADFAHRKRLTMFNASKFLVDLGHKET
jgi:hypothetical protein